MSGFDLKAPSAISSTKQNLQWGLGALLVAGLIVGGSVYMKSRKPSDVKPGPRIAMPGGFDPDFFAPPAPAAAPPAAAETQAAEAAKAAPPAVQEVPELINPKTVQATPPARPPLTAREVFKPLPPTAAASRADEINNSRRGASTLRVWLDGAPVEQKAPSDADWGEAKSVASFPLDMARVIPVTRRISAVLVEAINSELEGKITAQIEENIYGGHGRNVLIPAGSMAVGRYKPLGKAGESRIAAFWSRIITPDGINIHLGNAELADAMGRSGITGDVDSRFFDRYGMALLVSSLSALTAYQVPVQHQGQAIVVQNFGSNLADLSSQILEANINIKPVVTVPAGSRIQISPTKDIWFKEPGDKSVDVVALNNNGKGRKQ